MKILITGGSGFLGSWIAKRLLDAGHQVRLFDIRANRQLLETLAPNAPAGAIEWHEGDIRKAGAVEAALTGCDRVIHLAGVLTPVCMQDPALGAEINLLGSLHVFAAARKLGLPSVVYASTAGVYGPDDPTTPLPATHYGAFKLAVEGSARAYWNDHRLPSVGFRPLVVYGPGRDGGLSAGPSLACRAAAWNQPYVMPFTGRSGLVYVDDVAAVFVHAALADAPSGAQVFDVIGETTGIDDLLTEIRRQAPGATLDASGPPLPIAAGQSEAAVDAWYPERPRTSLANGVAATLAYYRAHPQS